MSEERIVVSDTGPLISLEKLTDGFEFIRLLYDTILISATVQLAHVKQLPIVIEEEAGRRVAWDLGMRISGIAGQVVKALRNEIE